MPATEPPGPPNRLASGRAAAAAALVLAAALDIAFGDQASLTVTLVFGPFVACALLPPRDTATFGAAALVGAFALGWPDGTAGTGAHLARTATVALGALLAVRLAHERTRRESKLAAVTTIAEAAQLAILHPLPAELGPLRLAGRYISATAEARVGGDFYDALKTPFGQRLLIGDVRGKGLDAVRLAALLLGEFRSRAATNAYLGDIVTRLDEVAAKGGCAEDFATAIVAEVGQDHITFVRCGHPQPLCRVDGRVAELDLGGTLPLGLGADGTCNTTLPLHATEQLLFFSDGAVETHDIAGRDFDIACAFEDAPPGLNAALEHLLNELTRHAAGIVADDVVLLLAEAQPSGVPSAPRPKREPQCP